MLHRFNIRGHATSCAVLKLRIAFGLMMCRPDAEEWMAPVLPVLPRPSCGGPWGGWPRMTLIVGEARRRVGVDGPGCSVPDAPRMFLGWMAPDALTFSPA
jgi:hypothetical protein